MRSCVRACVRACVHISWAVMVQASPIGGRGDHSEEMTDFVTSMVEGHNWMRYFGLGHLLMICAWPFCCDRRNRDFFFCTIMQLSLTNWILGHFFLANSPPYDQFLHHLLHFLFSVYFHLFINAYKMQMVT